MKILYLYLFLFVFASNYAKAQRSDSLNKAIQADSIKANKATKKAIYGTARKATIFSACLPGLGQIYNKKYWKVPIIYAALGGIIYWGSSNQSNYKLYSNNLRAIFDNDPETNNTTVYSADQLISEKKYYKKQRDMAIMLGGLVYVINIIDANVDAHLKTFDISDNLSLQLKPYGNIDFSSNLQTGLSVKLNFK